MAWPFKPTERQPLFDTDDTGKFVAGILLQGSKLLGQRVFGATDWYTLSQVVAAIEKVTGKKAKYQEISHEVFKSFLPTQMATEMSETFLFMRDYAYYGPGAEQGLIDSLKVCACTKYDLSGQQG